MIPCGAKANISCFFLAALNIQAHEEQLMALREASWQGRAEGMDIDRSHDLRDSRTFKVGGLRKKVQRGELPPLLSDVSNNAVCKLYCKQNVQIDYSERLGL